MIGKLKGVVDSVGEDEAVIDVNGVGYLVHAGSRTLSRLSPGESVSVHVETHVREDAIKLFAFLTDQERAWFVRLQAVQGVGARHALALLDAIGPGEIESAAALGDSSAFARARGVGPKLAQRIATELKDKAPPAGRTLGFGAPLTPAGSGVPAAPGASAARDSAVSALINLGYGESDARRAAAAALRDLGEDASEGALIKAALKELAR
ncbi:Holliday junction branch migration protein RuvA [Alkalicaulis satelles]|uniref:Holliday junction branch migration complex subunit RuvA n=1 Tax=Alkalicaulis satelles TaxID=2609175 RepID=A0A5M6ZC84_9PROT|nr:Holliday junction branch migration protein RuvA [Alkalicaulis satelles]KAA5802343.1 Holliday junction branch migration protein RuvA [Alkalicaulis satelles]